MRSRQVFTPSPCQTGATKRILMGILLGVGSLSAHAEEGGSGHYLPGSMSSFIDGVPPKETFIARLNVVNYEGSRAIDAAIPIGGQSVLGADVSSQAYGLTLLWRPPVEIGEGWSYAMSATIPYVQMDVSGSVEGAPGSVVRSDSESGLGDVVLMPLMVNYTVNPDFSMNFRAAAYAPSGSYEVGRLANTGKNFWTLEPTFALMYMGTKNGIEASLFTGIDINQENEDTQYKSGNQFHMDGTLAQHFPYAGGLVGVGVTGYYYKQVTGDSGEGATFGDFKAKTVGVGPVASYISKIGDDDLLLELKWLHETSTEKRLKGDTIFLKALIKY